jgi:hypothetical protein
VLTRYNLNTLQEVSDPHLLLQLQIKKQLSYKQQLDDSTNPNMIEIQTGGDVVDDTSPQLGGDLDTNSFNIAFDDAHGINDENGNEQIIFQTTSSAVNQFDITNAATGNAPSISATGGDSNIDVAVIPKGTGETKIGTGAATATLTSSGAYDLTLDTNSGTNSGTITITDGANGQSLQHLTELVKWLLVVILTWYSCS